MSLANRYHFVTRWRIAATIEGVAAILRDPVDLPRWWPSVYLSAVEVAPGGPDGCGQRVRLHARGWLPYTLRWELRVVQSDYPRGFAIEASGDLAGTGVWAFDAQAGVVTACFDWRVRAEKPLLRRLSWLLRPMFAANHRWAMRQGCRSLRQELQRRRARGGRP